MTSIPITDLLHFMFLLLQKLQPIKFLGPTTFLVCALVSQKPPIQIIPPILKSYHFFPAELFSTLRHKGLNLNSGSFPKMTPVSLLLVKNFGGQNNTFLRYIFVYLFLNQVHTLLSLNIINMSTKKMYNIIFESSFIWGNKDCTREAFRLSLRDCSTGLLEEGQYREDFGDRGVQCNQCLLCKWFSASHKELMLS